MSSVQNKTENGGNLISIKVKYLDDHIECFTMNGSSLGSELYQKISIRMQLIESYFFGLQYVSLDSNLCWLDLRKVIRKQTDYKNEFAYEFCIKFYTPDPNLLHDHLTKKLFVLQLKKDITNGELICCESTKILLGGLFLQLQFPDSENLPLEEIETFLMTLFNDQCLSPCFIDQCLKFHFTLKCQTVVETHFDLLEIVRKIDFYGMKLHPAKDNEGLSLNLAVYHMGIVIFQKYTKINTFNWSKIRKLSFKRKRFLIKLHPEEYLELFVLWVVQGFYKDTLEFYFDSRNSCKNFWKKCIEHHAFFRTHVNSSSALQSKSNKKLKFRRSCSGSRFRYIGLTQFELDQLHKETYHLDNLFHRSESDGRLASPSQSSAPLTRRNSENKFNSNHSLSVYIKPSIDGNSTAERKDREISDNHVFVNRDGSPWERHVTVKDSKFQNSNSSNHISKPIATNSIETTDSLCSNGHEPYSFVDGANRFIKYLPSTSTSDDTVPLSLNNIPEVINYKDNQDSIDFEDNFCSNFNEYAFVPNFLAQISRSECSKLNQSMNLHGNSHDSKTFDDFDSNRNSNNFTSITPDTLSSQSALKSIEKEFLFNEFTYLKELQLLFEIMKCCVRNSDKLSQSITGLHVHLDQLKSATKLLIAKLEKIIQINIQSLTTSWEHIRQFLTIVSEYCQQIQDNLKCYIKEIKEFTRSLIQSGFSANCFNSPQLDVDQQTEKNLLRLFISPIIQQRAHLSCLSVFILFIPPDDDDKLICQEVIVRLREAISNTEDIEETTHMALLVNLIRGFFIYQENELENLPKCYPIRIGWLQKLSNKGASNRLFILQSDQLICAKKIPNSNFTVEHRWFLQDIRVGTMLDMMKIRNGYDAPLSPFDSITIMLWDPGASDSRYSSVVLLADTNKSRSIWIEEIKKAALAFGARTSSSIHPPEDISQKSHSTNESKHWSQKYRLVDICWHDRVSMSRLQFGFLFQFSLSAYLLRKYKSSNNWQRLWVVLADCHLFFYQSHVNTQAITSLCLVGFQISQPSPQDSITKSWVIKLEKESKICFLRTENQYFYHRWRTALSYCTFSNI